MTDKGCSSLGPMLFNIFINDIASEIRLILSMSADYNNLSGAEGCDAIHRDLYRLKRWAEENLIRFCKAPGPGHPQYQCKLGDDEIEDNLDLRVLVDESWTGIKNVQLQPRKQIAS